MTKYYIVNGQRVKVDAKDETLFKRDYPDAKLQGSEQTDTKVDSSNKVDQPKNCLLYTSPSPRD